MAGNNRKTTTGTSGMGNPTIVAKITRPRLWEFTIHFRRPESKPSTASAALSTVYYDGSYGFDWLRDEYIYDIEEVHELGIDPMTGRGKLARLYQGSVTELMNEYTRLNRADVDLTETQNIKTVIGERYIPAWLAVFPTTHASRKNRDGVDLYLQVEQDKILNSDTTPIVPIKDPASITISFETDEGITVTADGINTLPDLMNVAEPELKRPFTGTELKSKVVKRYKDSSKAINIKAVISSSKVRFVKIRATDTLDNTTRIVGLLCVYPNAAIKKAAIKVVHCLTHRSPQLDGLDAPFIERIPYTVKLGGGKTGTGTREEITRPSKWASSAPDETDILLELGHQSFNQALIDTTIDIDYIDLSSQANTRIKQFLSHPNYQRNASPDHYSRLMKQLADIYYQEILKNTDIESDDNNITYLFLTEYSVKYLDKTGSIGGAAWPACNGGQCDSVFRGGNFAIVFETGRPEMQKLVHELGHSLSLPHTFPKPQEPKYSNVHYFYIGYTDNVMDYNAKAKPLTAVPNTPSLSNRYTMNATFKWQWDILRSDNTVGSS